MVNEYLNAAVLSFVSSAIFFGFNGLVIWGLSRAFRFRFHGVQRAFILAGIAAVVSFLVSLLPTFLGNIGQRFMLNLAMFLVNTAVFVLLAKKIYDESWGKTAALWLIVFVADFLFGFFVALILAIVTAAMGISLPAAV